MGIKNMLARAGGKAADKVAKLASLSPEQLMEVEELKDAYLSEMPDPSDTTAQEMTMRLLASAGIEVYNAYLPQIKQLYLPISSDIEFDGSKFKPSFNIRYFNITKWVSDVKENSLEKLVNVYATLSNEDCNIALIFHRTVDGTETYLAVTNTKNSDTNTDADNYQQRLADALRGNFPGSEWTDPKKGTIPFLKSDISYSIASASNIPTEKSEKFISQTIEKLLDGIVPTEVNREYTIILLATPVRDVEERKLRLAELYSGLAPYAGWQTNFTYSESNSTNSSATFGVNAGVSAGVQHGQNQAITNSQGTTDSENQTITDSENSTVTDSTSQTQTDTTGVSQSSGSSQTNTSNSSHTVSDGTNISGTVNASVTTGETVGAQVGVPGLSANASTNMSATVGASATTGANHNISDTVGESVANTVTENLTNSTSQAIANTVGQAIAKSTGRAVANSLGRAVTNTVAKTAGAYKGVNFGGNFGANFARSSNVTATVGKNEGITQSFTNFSIKHALNVLEEQMQRYEQSVALGMWDFAAYVLSEDINTVNNVAHSYLALTQGEKSYLSQAAVNLWRGDVLEEKGAAKEICKYLRDLRHPLFGINPEIVQKDHTFSAYPSVVTATTSLSGKELAYSLNFPQRSVVGLPVLQCAEFGRGIVSYTEEDQDDMIRIGQIFHMNHVEKTEADISLNSLTGHTFITGSTGSGKSNTIYQILNKALENNKKFLVIEPAKGEYKKVFGGREDVTVYSTNPSMSALLRINPFSFPKSIHILEHLDRLIEIFNVCWPMYAAMPAVLKNAVEKSYTDCGWNLISSTNKYDENLYPGFSDVARNIKYIVESSEYDDENKGAYKGSLLTRLQSLSTGINGLIFNANEISASKLFDQNAIVDLSRVGSTETKSLIIGMLVLKLQEYRMSLELPMNSELKHLTVLEEAHNILRRTSIDQPTEGSNILGKSVEMLANAIAEMRTYGEGFVIADQSPGLMDMSVIRNTNTKIIMRLPDQSDRELVGKAAGLNDDQIIELSKLPRGVAALYQNEWIQPVLCKIDKYSPSANNYKFDVGENESILEENLVAEKTLLDCIMDNELFQVGDREDLRELKSIILRSNLDCLTKVNFIEYIDSEKEDGIEKLRKLLYPFLHTEEALKKAEYQTDVHEWTEHFVEELEPSITEYSTKQIDLVVMLLLQEKMNRDASYKMLLNKFIEVYRKEGGVF